MNISSTLYDYDYTNNINQARNNFYKNQKIMAKDPTNYNVIAPYARTIINQSNKFNNDVMGPVVDDVKDIKNYDLNSFDKQFDLYKFDKHCWNSAKSLAGKLKI